MVLDFTVHYVLLTLYSTRWSSKDLEAALRYVQERNVPVKMAAAAHGIPKSMLYDDASGRVEFGSKCGPNTILRNWLIMRSTWLK